MHVKCNIVAPSLTILAMETEQCILFVVLNYT